LRADAEKRRGPKFDVKSFHDVLLGGGAVSLPVLREQIEGWLAGAAAPVSAATPAAPTAAAPPGPAPAR
jgi:hypothetical protein